MGGQAAAPAPTPSTETTTPAPNPWAPLRHQAPPTSSASSATPQAPGLGAPLGQGGGMFTSPGMQSLMGQMRDNPTLMSQMMSAPYMQGIFRGLQDNPEQAAAILSNNPMSREPCLATADGLYDASTAAANAEPANSAADEQPGSTGGHHADPAGHGPSESRSSRSLPIDGPSITAP